MISLGKAFAQQAVDDAFRKLLGERVGQALVDGDREAFRADCHDLVETHRRASRAIDRNLSE